MEKIGKKLEKIEKNGQPTESFFRSSLLLSRRNCSSPSAASFHPGCHFIYDIHIRRGVIFLNQIYSYLYSHNFTNPNIIFSCPRTAQ